MHIFGWDTDPEILEIFLKGFNEGQFLIKTPDGLVLRGEIKEAFLRPTTKKVVVTLEWLAESRPSCDEFWKPELKWFPHKSHPSVQTFIEVGFIKFYYQPKKDRLKMSGDFGETCWFFKPEDTTNLVREGDTFVSQHRH